MSSARAPDFDTDAEGDKTDAIDPEDVPSDYHPAIISLVDEDGEFFVAHHYLGKQGWLNVVGWLGTRRKIPSRRVEYVETAPTRVEDDEDGFAYQVVTDPELVESARQVVGLGDDRDSQQQRAVADGGEQT